MFWQNESVLFFTHANPREGALRVSRCLSIAGELKKNRIQSKFLTGDLPRTLKQKIVRYGYCFEECGDEHPGQILERLVADNRQFSQDWLVIDRDDVVADSISMRTTQRILHFGEPTKLTVHSPVQQASVDFQAEFELVSPEFHIDFKTSDSKKIKTTCRRLLLILSDDQAVNRVFELIRESKLPIRTVDIVKKNAGLRLAFGNEIKCDDIAVRIHNNFDRIDALCELADISIVDNYEAFLRVAFHGVPCVFDPALDANVADAFCEIGCAQALNSEAAGQIRKLVRTPKLRLELAARAQRLVDGRGAERIVRFMLASGFKIRKCHSSDARCLLDWRNDPEMRVVSFQQSPIDWESHQNWFRSRLACPKTEIYIIENSEGKSVGQFRFEFGDQYHSVRIHLSLVPSLRGFGLGTAIIERASRFAVSRFPGIRVFAQIKSFNLASQAAFRKAGFEPAETSTINGQVALSFVRRNEIFPVPSPPIIRKAA